MPAEADVNAGREERRFVDAGQSGSLPRMGRVRVVVGLVKSYDKPRRLGPVDSPKVREHPRVLRGAGRVVAVAIHQQEVNRPDVLQSVGGRQRLMELATLSSALTME